MRFLLNRQLTIAEKNMELLNAAGDANVDILGIRQEITTLTAFTKKIVEQKFFTFSIADYVPVDVGQGAWMGRIDQAREFYTGGSFYEGDINDHTGDGKISEVSAAVDIISIPTQVWARKVTHTVPQLRMAQNGALSWDIVTAKLRSLKKSWDLGIQETAMLGHKTVPSMNGLLTSPDAASETSLLPVALSAMTQTQMQAFVGGVLGAYRTNCDHTAYPNRFVIPESDFLGLGNPFPGSVAQVSMLEYLTNMFKAMTGNQDFRILPMPYCESARMATRGENLNRYALYNLDIDSLIFNIPVDFTILGGLVVDGITYPQTAIGQYSGLQVKRPRELFYLDRTAN